MKRNLIIIGLVAVALFFIVRIVQHTCAEITQVYRDVKVNAMKLNYPIKYMDEFQHDLPNMDFETFKARYGSVLNFEYRGLKDAQRFLNKLESQQQKE